MATSIALASFGDVLETADCQDPADIGVVNAPSCLYRLLAAVQNIDL